MNEPNAVAVARIWQKECEAATLASEPTAICVGELRAICTALIAESERAKRLHEAVRELALEHYAHEFTFYEGACRLCNTAWSKEGENHAPDCLAAPLSKETP